MRLAVRGVPKGALRTHSAQQAPLWGGLVTCRGVLFARAPVFGLCFFVSVNAMHLGLYSILRLPIVCGIYYNNGGSRNFFLLRNTVGGDGGWGCLNKGWVRKE